MSENQKEEWTELPKELQNDIEEEKNQKNV